ncbi:MAG: S-adenosylmethionine:tRNA ribosyltransferase-isomerase [Candidatus Methanoperedens nitroreducens]|uniref:S-adenosylmethionine:tRNA ribosyltransferase-isomerase n=1 Tax=Candidatus Methanoperedens nitratireducens TaxID=1392998 RepID=A0A0P8AEB4_9EURY|nr:MAG: S-adenosylmethionine:tRNA ribosyltransferase-isomerase [Candidatus Methanoperedens sp. BLZ1]
MKLSEFDYHLPKELIAQSPIEPRDASKLMVVGQQIENRFFCDVLDYFEAGDTLVLNDSRVIPAKLMGKKSTGGHVEALVVSRNDAGYECMIRGKNIREGTKINFGELEATVLRILEKPNINRYLVNFNCNGNLPDILEKIGEAPLPSLYQTKTR